MSKLKAAYYPDFGLKELVSSLWIESERDYDVSASYRISHRWFKRKELNITRHSAPSDRHAVISHMRIPIVIYSMAREDENDDVNANNPPQVPPTQQAPYTLSNIKLPILKKEDHLAKFYKMIDAKEMWEAIKSRFGGNDESKKMQKYILKQQFKSFSASPLKMPIRSSLGLYLLPGPKVFEPDVKGSTASSSSTHNVAFVSSKSTSSTNEVSIAYGVSTFSSHNSQREGSSSYTGELISSFFVVMISMRLKKFYKKTGRKLQFDAKEPVGFDKTKVECFNCHNTGHFGKECRSKGNQESRKRDAGNIRYKARDNGIRSAKQDEHKAMVTIDGDGVDWTGHAKDDTDNYALMAFNSRNSGSDTELFVEDSPVYDRFAKVEGMHAVPPLMTRIYMPPKLDFGIDESKFTYGPKQSKTSESDAKISDFASCESNSSVETLKYVPKPAVNEPKAVNKPKVWSDAPIIEEYKSDASNDKYMIKPSKEQEKPRFAFINTVKHVKTPRETVKEQKTFSPIPKADKRDRNGLMSKKLGLGYGFTRKACFVCDSFDHLIRDCDFHEKRKAKLVELNKQKGKGTGQGENRPVWNNVQRLNHQNKFVPKAVLTKTGRFPVNAARQNLSSQATATSTAWKVNTARPIVNEIRPRNNFYKSHSPIRRPFNRTTAPKSNFTNHKVNTAGDKTVSAVGGNRETTVKALAGYNWRSKRHYWNKVSKYNSGSNSSKNDDLQKGLKNKGIVNSGCSRYMTGNKAYLVEYQDYNGGLVAFRRSKGQITRTLPFRDMKVEAISSVCISLHAEKPLPSANLNVCIAIGLACSKPRLFLSLRDWKDKKLKKSDLGCSSIRLWDIEYCKTVAQRKWSFLRKQRACRKERKYATIKRNNWREDDVFDVGAASLQVIVFYDSA
ncbi:ribonuclease H-like domain-containing protein [Tanacetum coccineum]